MLIGVFMVGCVPETIPVRRSNPDRSMDAVRHIEETKEVVETVKRNSRRHNRAKKTDETE